jgi:V/A-type H+-transporting ATPase subunit I
MMLSDAGYGIIIVIATSLALLKKKNMGEGMKRTMKMFLYCGISTTFWGFMFGSFFGDAVNVIATTFFGRPDIKLSPIWFDQLDSPMRMLSFCFLVGIIHLFVGLGAKAYGCFKNHDPLGALYDCIFWYMLVGGAIFYLLTLPMMSSMLGIATLSAGVGKVAGVVAIIGLIGVILTGGRESHNWFKRILKGLYSAYGITSWLSDILSYSRLLALGLATGVIAQVFNKMGSMVATGTGLIGVIFFIIIFIIGHTLNLLINALGAYVHTNRLEYVEFFGKFYDGGGKAFEPFKQNTKYFTIKEEL